MRIVSPALLRTLMGSLVLLTMGAADVRAIPFVGAPHLASAEVMNASLDGSPGITPDADELPVFSFPQSFEPPGDGRPDSSRGSGARGGCEAADALDSEEGSSEIAPMGALMPSQNFGLTTQSHPMVFINFGGHIAPRVVLRFEDETGTYSERVSLVVDPALPIQGFALPAEHPSLELGKNYRWTLLVACDGQVNPYHPVFSGWVQRASQPNLPSYALAQQVDTFTQQGFWYDAVALLYQALEADPADATAQSLWAQLLAYVEQEPATAQPLSPSDTASH